jgi:acetyltransferase-like isoleucine patch superfamily enzyme
MEFQRGALSWDWYDGVIPDNTEVAADAYLETTFSFHFYRSKLDAGLKMGTGSSTYLGTMFDVGTEGTVALGNYSLVHGARIICDAEITIGEYVFISWNVVLMDTYRFSTHRETRRTQLRQLAQIGPKAFSLKSEARPVRIDSNVWIGFDACVLPGVRIGEGSIVGARSVVMSDVEPYTIVAGNPARVIRRIEH